jgi:hypothetical protein
MSSSCVQTGPSDGVVEILFMHPTDNTYFFMFFFFFHINWRIIYKFVLLEIV